MSSTLDKVKKFRQSRPQQGGFTKTRGIFYNFDDNDNIVRLVGEFLECKQHFIAPAPKRNERGLCIAEAFKGEDALPKMINCLDWDPEKEEPMPKSTCPICALNAIIKKTIKDAGSDIDPGDKEFLENLKRNTNVNTSLKWNVLDRSDPYIVEISEEGNEEKVLGYKVANIGMEAWGDIDGIYRQIEPTDPAGIDEGVDINIRKGHNGARTCYSAQIVMQGTHAKETPLTDEEKELELHDLKRIVGKHPDRQKLIDALHEDLREILEGSDDFEGEGDDASDYEETSAVLDDDLEEEDSDASSASLDDDDDSFGFDSEEDDSEEDEEDSDDSEEDEEDSEEDSDDATTWQCFGTCDDKNHPECAQCGSVDECVKENESKQEKLKKAAKKGKGKGKK